jgi:flagellar basal-body rod protein FlgC
MMKALTIFDVSGRAMAAQQVRLNTVASNLANVMSISGSADTVYKPMKPVFETQYSNLQGNSGIATVDTVGIQASNAPPEKRYEPNHPLADKDGFIYAPPIDQSAEMVDMLETSRQYQNNIEVLSTAKTLMLKTISVGK